jgi:exopolyphosphatase / guanosine-5'-triphosphate,3'-diphosphate pyrophosphatase
MKVAALDLGSNTFLCLICEVVENKITQVYSDSVEVVRLGQGLSESKNFHPEALLRAEKTLTEFRKIIDRHRPEKILAMATSAARDAENKNELFVICQNLNIPLQIISGDQEAQITYAGSVSGSRDQFNKTKLVIDIGGGSTEFIFGQGTNMNKGLSQNIGCVRLTEQFFKNEKITNDDVQKCRNFIRQSVLEAQSLLNREAEEILAVAGTPTTLVAAELGVFDPQKIDGYQLTKEKLEWWMDRLKGSSYEEKIKMGIPAGRADVILVGVLILLECLQVFKHSYMITSTRGVRYGIALQMV